MNKYWKALSVSFLGQIKEKGHVLGKGILYIIIVYLFSQIFESVNASSDRLWYFAMTQAIILSTSSVVLQIEKDIRDNQISYFLVQPVNYLLFRYFEAIGSSVFRYSILIILCFLSISFLKGPIQTNPSAIIFSLFLGIMGILLYIQISLLIGVLAYWIHDIKNLLYFNLTATFCFGGLIVPIQLYPPFMQKICFFTPYPWILWWPANFFSSGNVNHYKAFIGWIIWTIIFMFLNNYIFQKQRKKIITKDS
ncbi:MAG: hypothetical protein K1060chlam4_00567 [Candidatus Anoxychlamydiales bacterium]|nr:hypothetical protein [Candidatus Anoxychlamydiales bacterium]